VLASVHTIFNLKLLHEVDFGVETLNQKGKSKEVLYSSNSVSFNNKMPLRILEVYDISRWRGNDSECAVNIRHGDEVLG
jgi:hypothetical protein